jgi:endonuclease/exonuclease/phosphatase family metal-dependent hydrolase
MLLLLVLITASPSAIAKPAHAVGSPLSVMTWNIKGSALKDSEIRSSDPSVKTIVSYIRASGADYVGLQEVSESHARDIAAELGWDMRTAFEHNGRTGNVGIYREGIAMLSRYRITNYSVYNLEPQGSGRKLQRAVIVKDGTEYHVYNTHLSSGDGWSAQEVDGNRNRQAEFVRDKVNAIEGTYTPVVIGGDMNSHPVPREPNTAAYDTLSRAFTDTWLYLRPLANSHPRDTCTVDSGCTIPIREDGDETKVKTPTRRIDYIFIRKGTGTWIRSATALPPTVPPGMNRLSDHYPYQVVLSPPPAAPAPPANRSPLASFTYNRRAGAGNIVYLDGGTSADPDGSISSWTWSRGHTTLATGRTATVSLGKAPSVDVTLTVRDNGGLTGSVTRTLVTPNRPPAITGSIPTNGSIVGTNTPTLAASATDDDGDPLQYSFRVTGPLTDVSSGWVGSTWKVPSSKLDPGTTYTWTVKARDSDLVETPVRTSTFTVAMLPTANELVSLSTGDGYWEVAGDGGVFSYGSAQFYGSLPGFGVHVNNIIGMARTPSDHGYWLVGKDGGVFAFGDAGFYGSLPGLSVNVNNIVGMAPTKDGKGYWLVGSDGGVFAFGNAAFFGSMGGRPLNAPVQAIAPTATSQGYWLAAEDGGVFAFGDAPFLGSMGGQPLNYPVVDIDATPDGRGYWLAAQDGGVFAFGNAGFFGSLAGQPLNGHINSMSTMPDGRGYWLNGCDGGVFSFGSAPFYGSQPRYACRGISY